MHAHSPELLFLAQVTEGRRGPRLGEWRLCSSVHSFSHTHTSSHTRTHARAHEPNTHSRTHAHQQHLLIRGVSLSNSRITEDGDEAPGWENGGKQLKPRETGGKYLMAMFLRTFPLTATVLLLVLTRIEPIGLKVCAATSLCQMCRAIEGWRTCVCRCYVCAWACLCLCASASC